jgi:hypothetical protein
MERKRKPIPPRLYAGLSAIASILAACVPAHAANNFR